MALTDYKKRKLEEQILESMTTKKRNRSFKNPPLYAKKGSHTLAVK